MAYTPAVFDPTKGHIGQDFTTATGYDKTAFGNCFGDPAQAWFSKTADGLWLTSSQPGWKQVGFMTATTGATSGFGYGTYHFRARSGQKGQGAGINLILWPATGEWFPASIKGTFGEMDVSEDWSGKGQPTATMHYDSSAAGASYVNGQEFHNITFADGGDDSSSQHDYDLIWTATSVELFVDGVSQFRDTGAHIPKSAADGGMNRTIGAQVVIQTTIEPLPTIQFMIANCWWSPSTTAPGATAATNPTPPVATSSGGPSGATPVPPPPSDATFTVQATVTAVGITYHVTKKTGAANTLRYFLDGKFVGVLRDSFPDCTKDLHELLPPVGAHVAGFTLDGSDLSAAVSFTVAPPTSTGPVVVPPVAPVATNSDIITAIATASASQLAAVRKDLGL